MMAKHFRFVNPNMACDEVNDKGKVVSFKEINAVADDEESARIKAYRKAIDGDRMKLGSDWILNGAFDVGKDW